MSSELDPANLNALTVAQINLRLKEKGLATTGTHRAQWHQACGGAHRSLCPSALTALACAGRGCRH